MSEHPPIPCPDCNDGSLSKSERSFLCDKCGTAFNFPYGMGHVEWSRLWEAWTRGMAVVPLPEPASLTSHYWKAAGRAVSSHVDDNGSAYVKLDGQLWLTGEAREVGRALIAASAAADRAEQLAAEQAKAVTTDAQ